MWLWACGLGIQLEPAQETHLPRHRLPPVDALPAWSSDASCHIPALHDRVERKEPDAEGWRVLRGDLDGKRGTDELRVLKERRKGFASNYVELQLDGRPWLKTSVVLSLSEIMHEVPFPEGADEAERRVIEESLFPELCSSPDPSLQLLIDDELRWHEGAPVLPPDYAVREEAGWRVYQGSAHASKGSLPVTYPRPLTHSDQVNIVATGQGVIAERDGAHAWLFVTRHHANLRWPSEFSASLENAGVEVTRHPTTMDEIAAPIIVFRSL